MTTSRIELFPEPMVAPVGNYFLTGKEKRNKRRASQRKHNHND